jgi:hypothetical protein
MPGGNELLSGDRGRSASYIHEEWSRGSRPRATTDFPAIISLF